MNNFLTKLLNMAMVQNFDVTLRQMLNLSCVEFCTFMQIYIIAKKSIVKTE
jgi:hypothetical protein